MEYKPEILQLAALRLSRGLSLETIAEKTKISCYYLRAIENLDLAKLPQGVYRNNFLNQYARMIDEDLAEDLNRKLIVAARKEAESQANAAAASGVKRSLKEMLARGAALLLLFSQGGSMFSQQAAPTHNAKPSDPRYQALRDFFERHKCPIVKDAAHFIEAADRNGLDWRLLPSIAFLESSGGKHHGGTNPLGWGSGQAKFQSTRQAIAYVAERLAKSPIYANKDIKTKLRIYNPARKDYATRVFEVMEQLGPSLIAAR